MCITRSLKRWRTANNPIFGQYIFNTIGSKIRIFFLKILITFFVALILKASKTYNNIKAKTIIVIDAWLNSLRFSLLL